MPQKECRATLYREIAYKLTRKMDSFDLENMLDLYDRYKEALPDSDRAAKQYFERRLHDIEKVKSQDNFTVGKARQMFARMLSEWDMNKMGTLLDLEGTSHVNKAHANSVIDKKMQNIWRQVYSYQCDSIVIYEGLFNVILGTNGCGKEIQASRALDKATVPGYICQGDR